MRKRQSGRKRVACVALVLSVLLALSGCAPRGEAGTGPRPGDTAKAPVSSYNPSYDYDYGYGSGERYSTIEDLGVQLTARSPESTFSLKVDTAAYSNVKRYIENGHLPPSDAVRTEELINWFSFDEPLQYTRNSPFGFYTELGPSPFDDDKYLAMIRVGTRDIDRSELPPSNLVFLIDVSGSMGSYDKLPLLQDSLAMLAETLGKDDRVSIVTYASGTHVALSGAKGSDYRTITDAIYSLSAGGSTYGEKGIQKAYEQAERNYIEGGNNRVILATDGDFNVGISNIGDLSDFIARKSESGVYLSVLGFGTGNIRDDIMETLAKDGNGNYSYIDNLKTAEKVLVNELASNLFTVADDVKAQVVFDPKTVRSYRLIGYENRMLKTEDFDDDRVDAGEIGVGCDVVALYEIELYEPESDLGAHLFDVNIRYKDPGESRSRLVEFPVSLERLRGGNSSDFRFVSAVALYGDYLRNSGNVDGYTLREITWLAEDNLGVDKAGYRWDFVELLYQLRSIG
ncbi:MAG: von Willebrand factor type A domain-containing protein [Coriobacteriia bacterium]|nr:von Willebrand factor type A domain-containing protein [Coriobacteriia bacterium]